MSTTYLPRQMMLGEGKLAHLDRLASELGVRHLFIIIDHFLVSPPLNYDQKIRKQLSKGVHLTFFTDFQGEPTTEHVSEAVDRLHQVKANGVIAIGGGSAIDLAKAVSLFAASPHLDWEEIPHQHQLNRLPLIAVPTTSGTGSEATKIMVIKNTETYVKMNPGHKDLVPDTSILDPELTISLPKKFTAYTGLDALTHAIEAYISTKATPVTDFYATFAIEKIGKHLPIVYQNGENLQARETMQMASCFAGIAFSNASTNLAHAAGRPLGAHFHIPHGLSVALLLPFVLRFSLDSAVERLSQIAILLGEQDRENQHLLAEKAVQRIEQYNNQFGIWQDALAYIDLDELKQERHTLVEDALNGNGIVTNRRIPERRDIEMLYLSLGEKLEKQAKSQTV
ncbi:MULTISPECIES: iron-containing alcohol dehydrogenase [Virgibacillus]|uniref:Ethanolamine utilization protein EutG n=2 Tax=Virgibacillus TaxID=84406 RepID=A0A024Q939_9BACI|nr:MULTISPECIES: iron-containing alcohol dehydrogenase [Virgibacillus]EQB37666.1 hypothetical protein M948_03685 [Virgibacillus sp. CM-4]MYL40405.1 iron-containing alcohol dehydrogenase [Virgibacillus massiliensis]GGJ59301.1 1,3-propanediol dehydrogenase [Virgibacillus kapii]CDQ38807.1 Ethanolamine utilization protein EutG [Virgibacillus massiliensis]